MAGGIGILDSGVGGLTVVREVLRQLPREEVIYIGDSARCPYGSRSFDQIQKFAWEMVHFLLQYELKAIVIACNTITAVLLDELRAKLPIPVIGVIEPGARAAIRMTKNYTIGVIGTQGTIQSGSYEKALLRIHPDLKITSVACPNLVPLVESGWKSSSKAKAIVDLDLAPLQGHGIDTLILGCTHYPILSDLIGQSMGEHVALISSAEETASELSLILAREHRLNTTNEILPHHHFYTTGDPLSFQQIAEDWLQREISVEKVQLKKSI